MAEKAEIRYAVLVEGKSQRQVARESGYSRNTIRRLLEDSGRPKYQLRAPRARREWADSTPAAEYQAHQRAEKMKRLGL